LKPITVYLVWPQSYTHAHFEGAYRFSMRHEVIVKQKASIPVANKKGTAVQFIFDLIWRHSRSKYLVALIEQETQR